MKTFVKVNTQPIKRFLKIKIDKLVKAKQAMLSIGLYLHRKLIETFEKQGSRHKHKKWAALAESTKRRKQKKGYDKILINTGDLRNSFTIFRVTNNEVTFGSRKEYMIHHQEGTEFIPQRKMLFISKTDRREIPSIYNFFTMR